MKQNKTYKILTGLALVAILTTTIVGSTMANYTTSADSKDSAKVAAVRIDVSATDFFNKRYKSDITELANNKVYTVQASGKVVAPGTGNKVPLYLNGRTELMVDANFSTDLELTGNWTYKDPETKEEIFYCPIEFTFDTKTAAGQTDQITVKGLDYTSKEDLIAAIASNLKLNDTFPAGQEFEYYTPIEISWNWPFSTGEENNAKDTALVTKSQVSPLSLNLKINSQFTQID